MTEKSQARDAAAALTTQKSVRAGRVARNRLAALSNARNIATSGLRPLPHRGGARDDREFLGAVLHSPRDAFTASPFFACVTAAARRASFLPVRSDADRETTIREPDGG
jgi:hypothetical protein